MPPPDVNVRSEGNERLSQIRPINRTLTEKSLFLATSEPVRPASHRTTPKPLIGGVFGRNLSACNYLKERRVFEGVTFYEGASK